MAAAPQQGPLSVYIPRSFPPAPSLGTPGLGLAPASTGPGRSRLQGAPQHLRRHRRRPLGTGGGGRTGPAEPKCCPALPGPRGPHRCRGPPTGNLPTAGNAGREIGAPGGSGMETARRELARAAAEGCKAGVTRGCDTGVPPPQAVSRQRPAPRGPSPAPQEGWECFEEPPAASGVVFGAPPPGAVAAAREARAGAWPGIGTPGGLPLVTGIAILSAHR